jgi:hypothetical protein
VIFTALNEVLPHYRRNLVKIDERLGVRPVNTPHDRHCSYPFHTHRNTLSTNETARSNSAKFNATVRFAAHAGIAESTSFFRGRARVPAASRHGRRYD